MDETPIKAGYQKGAMKKGYLWPLYGDKDEIAFLFSPSRGKELIVDTLKDFEGTLLC
jgi:transposase